jgi:hypothetical protein
MPKQLRNFYFSNQVYQRNNKKVQYGRLFSMEYCKPVITPMQTSCKLRKDDDSKSTDQRQYRSMIGSLLYVTASKPYVMQAVGQMS